MAEEQKRKLEQISIAVALTGFDDKVAAIKVKINKLETFKKGLLQPLFV